MNPDLFRLLAILLGGFFGFLLSVIGTLVLLYMKDTRQDMRDTKQTVNNHWTEILSVKKDVEWIKDYILGKKRGIGDGDGKL